MATIARARAVRGAPRKPRVRRARFARLRPALRSLGRGLKRAGRALMAAPLAVRLVVFGIA
ncbi:MAG: hypothetical protein ACHQ7H_03540, partial [Candidatus Rokuibacteriota bacterium]